MRVISIWRKDLVHINKTRDNHFRYYGKYFDFTLLVSSKKNFGPHIVKNNTKIVVVNGKGGVPFFYIRCFAWIMRQHYKRNFDALLTPIGEEPVGWLLSLLLLPNRPKLIYDLWDLPGHSVTSYSFFHPKRYFIKTYYYLLKKILKKGDVVISGILSKGLEKYNIDSSKIIRSENGIQPEAFSNNILVSGHDEWKWVGDKFQKILYIGYIHKTRGADLLVEYALYIKNHNVLAKILIVGPSDETTFERLCKKINEFGVEDVVHLHRELPSSCIPRVIADADICICALDNIEKYKWSYPVKIYEYLASGKAVVASDLLGISEIIINGYNGLLYKAEDNKDFYSKVNSIIDNRMLRDKLQKNAALSVENKTYESIVCRISQSINTILRV